MMLRSNGRIKIEKKEKSKGEKMNWDKNPRKK